VLCCAVLHNGVLLYALVCAVVCRLVMQVSLEALPLLDLPGAGAE